MWLGKAQAKQIKCLPFDMLTLPVHEQVSLEILLPAKVEWPIKTGHQGSWAHPSVIATGGVLFGRLYLALRAAKHCT